MPIKAFGRRNQEEAMTVHLAVNGVTLCGYVPPNGWARDQMNRWTSTDTPEQCSCAACAKVLQAKPKKQT